MPSTRREDDPLGLLGKELLGRYLVRATMAYGGMSVVYEGHDVRLRRPVCIKVFHRLDPRDPAYRTTYEHFVQEAFALSQLKHPNTLRIYDFGYLEEEPKSPFHVCELLDGGTVAQHVRRHGPMTPAQAVEILEPVIGALSEAHARGVVHRDLKPNNVLFGSAGTSRVVKLVDFGIAKALADAEQELPHQADDTSAAAGQRMSLYSPGWAAPEQLRADEIGPTADVFSLGLLTAYLVTGRTIFSTRGNDYGDERAASDAHVVRKLEEWKVDVKLSQVIVRACREAPRDRYRSVEEMGTALRAAVQDAGAAASRAARLTPQPLPGMAAPVAAIASVVEAAAPALLPVPPPAVPPLAGGSAGARPIAARAEPRPTPTTLTRGIGDRPPSPTLLPTPMAGGSEVIDPPARDAPATAAVLVLDRSEDGEFLAAGRRLRLLAVAETIDVGGDDGPLRSPARLRLTLLPDAGKGVRLHVKGLNCFVSRQGERPSGAVSIDEDEELDLLAPDRRRLDVLRCLFGSPGAANMTAFPLGAVTLAVPPRLRPAILLDVGPGRDLALVHRVLPVPLASAPTGPRKA